MTNNKISIQGNSLEKTIWASADKLRSNMDAAEYKHVVLRLIYLKYIADSFGGLYKKLEKHEYSKKRNTLIRVE